MKLTDAVPCGVYRIRNLVNGKVYVGSSARMPLRWIGHRCHLKQNVHGNSYLQASYNKYGPRNFELSVLRELPADISDEERYAHEQHFMDLAGAGPHRCDPDRVYNLCPRAGGGAVGDGNVNALPIDQFDLAGNLLRRWTCIRTAAREVNINSSGITMAANGTTRSAGGYIWRRPGDADTVQSVIDAIEATRAKRVEDHIPVTQYDLDGNFIKRWDWVETAARELGIRSIWAATRGTNRTAGGYIWMCDKAPNPKRCGVNNGSARPVDQYDLDGQFLKRWPYVLAAARELDISASKIVSAAGGRRHTAGRFAWRYGGDHAAVGAEIKAADLRMLKKGANAYQARPVLQYDLAGNFVRRWPYMRAAALELGIAQGNMTSVARGRLRHAGGFVWRYDLAAKYLGDAHAVVPLTISF